MICTICDEIITVGNFSDVFGICAKCEMERMHNLWTQITPSELRKIEIEIGDRFIEAWMSKSDRLLYISEVDKRRQEATRKLERYKASVDILRGGIDRVLTQPRFWESERFWFYIMVVAIASAAILDACGSHVR